MNKKSILLILSSTLALGANAQGKYTINGNLLNADGQKINLKGQARLQTCLTLVYLITYMSQKNSHMYICSL